MDKIKFLSEIDVPGITVNGENISGGDCAYWDHVITEDSFKDGATFQDVLNSAKGRVYVKYLPQIMVAWKSVTINVPSAIKYIEFDPSIRFSGDPNGPGAIIIQGSGIENDCQIISGANISGNTPDYTPSCIKGFKGSVEHCHGDGWNFEDCNNIQHCTFSGFTNCNNVSQCTSDVMVDTYIRNISNCTNIEDLQLANVDDNSGWNSYSFNDCKFIKNISYAPGVTGTANIAFNRCEYISNIDVEASYTDCTKIATSQEADYWNYIVTDIEKLDQILATGSGRVLIKDIEFDTSNKSSYNYSIIGEGITHIQFENIHHKMLATGATAGLQLTLVGNNHCSISGLQIALGDYDSSHHYSCTIMIKNFSEVYNINVGGSDYEEAQYNIENCKNIHDSTLYHIKNSSNINNVLLTGDLAFINITNCSHINNINVGDVRQLTFNNCKYINGVTPEATNYASIIFNNCSHLENIKYVPLDEHMSGIPLTYTNCTYVNPFTCDKYVAEEDIGKVPVITGDGSYKAISPAAAEYIEALESRVENLEGSTLKYIEDNSVAYKKSVPANAAPYALIEKIGGMTYMVEKKIKDIIQIPTQRLQIYAGSGFGGYDVSGNTPLTFEAGKYYRISYTGELPFYCVVDGDYNHIFDYETVQYCTETVTVDSWSIYFEGESDAYDEGAELYSDVSVTIYEFEYVLEDTKVTTLESRKPTNLFKESLVVGGYVSGAGQFNPSSAGEKSFIFECEPNTTYTLSKLETTVVRVGGYTTEPTNKLQGTLLKEATNANTKLVTFNTASNNYIAVFYLNTGESSNNANVIASMALYEGSTVPEGENLNGAIIDTFAIPEAVQPKHGVSRSIYDYIEWEESGARKSHKCVEKMEFDGTEQWTIETGTTYVRFGIPLTNALSAWGAASTNLLSNRYVVGAAGYSSTPCISIEAKGWLYIEDSSFDTVVELKAHLAELYESGNPLTIIYALAEPIETDISDTLSSDNFIKVVGGGTIEAVNEAGNENAVPTTIEYVTKL